MGILALLGWLSFIVACVVGSLDRRHFSMALEQKDNAIAAWRAENGRLRGKVADGEQIVELLRFEVKRLTPKRGEGGRFASGAGEI